MRKTNTLESTEKDFLSQLVDHQPMSRADLERIREWAIDKLAGSPFGAGHPDLIRVRESADAILARMNSGMPSLESSLRKTPDRKTHLVLAWSKDSRDTNR
jgi:hypothetical protein